MLRQACSPAQIQGELPLTCSDKVAKARYAPGSRQRSRSGLGVLLPHSQECSHRWGSKSSLLPGVCQRSRSAVRPTILRAFVLLPHSEEHSHR